MNLTSIGIFGRRNSGKSSIVNFILGQNYSIVSDFPGTTTDPIKKRIEIFGIGPCQLIDTAGIDDDGLLGKMRVEKSKEMFAQVDIAILVFTGNYFDKLEIDTLKYFKKRGTPLLLLHNQSDIVPMDSQLGVELTQKYGVDVLEFSCCYLDEGRGKSALDSLLSLLVKLSSSVKKDKPIFEGVIEYNSLPFKNVVLVCPIDNEAPTGRLILPQVMAIRDLLDRSAVATVLLPETLSSYLNTNPSPDLVVTDSQVFKKVSEIVPKDILLTSFSMLLARSKGCFEEYINGTRCIDQLKDGDRILILESCTHHASCEDIGRVKLPSLFKKYTSKGLEFDIVAGLDKIVNPITDYALVAQCGGCMITGNQIYQRLLPALENNIPVTNYGMAIAFMTGIFERAIKPLMK